MRNTIQTLRLANLAVVALCSGLLAHAAATMIRSALDQRLAAQPLVGLRRSVPVLRPHETPNWPLARNIFCSTCPIGETETERSNDLGPAGVRTTLPLRLLATLITVPPADARWSMAVIRDDQRRVAGPFAVGDSLRGAVITGIEPARVLLMRDRQREFLPLTEVAMSDPTPTTPGALSTGTASNGMTKVGRGRYEIDRDALDRLLANTAALAGSVRVQPEIRNGQPSGLRLVQVDPASPIARLGLQSGDVLTAINGLDLTTPENALTAYTQLRAASHLEITFERAGIRLSNQYRIR